MIPLFFRPRPAPGTLLLIAALGLFCSREASGQEIQELVTACGGSSQSHTELCHRAAAVLETARGGLGAAATWGSETPGSASTFGYRLQDFPRIALSTRVGLSRFSMVKVPTGYANSAPVPEEDIFVPSVHLLGTVAVLNGFSPSPTMGGVLALDLTVSTHGLFPPGDEGFQQSQWGWGVGARLGVFRESFTLPGVSLSATRRWMGSTEIGDMGDGGAIETDFDLEVTSFRGVFGKDIMGIGLLAGMGWDRISGDGRIRARVSPTGPESSASASDLASKRRMYFGGASMTFLIAQISTEIGWSEPVDQELPIDPSGGEFPSNGAYFASLALRLTF